MLSEELLPAVGQNPARRAILPILAARLGHTNPGQQPRDSWRGLSWVRFGAVHFQLFIRRSCLAPCLY